MEPHVEEQQRVAEKKKVATRTRLFRPVAGDIEILTHLYGYRLLTRLHLAALTGRDPKRLHRRLKNLLDHRFIKRIELPLAEHIYYLGVAAFPVLMTHGAMT